MNIVFCMEKSPLREKYVSMLKSYAERKDVAVKLNVYPDTETMLFGLEGIEFQIDIIFFDVESAGFNDVETLRKKKFYGEIIYLTQVEDQWEKAFDVEAFHYVIEQHSSKERFEWIIGKAMRKVKKKHEETLALFCAGKRVVLPIRDIFYFEVKERWVTAYYGEEHFEFFSRLGKIEETLRGKGFVRVHRSYLVAARYIVTVKYNELTLLNGTDIPIGRGKYPEVRSWFERMEGGS